MKHQTDVRRVLTRLRTQLRREREATRAQRAAKAAGGQPAATKTAALSDHELFVRTVGAVKPLRATRRADVRRPKPLPLPRQRMRDERAALLDSLSDAFEPATLLAVDDTLSYRRSGVGLDVPRRLRRGQWSVQAEPDLHGCTSDQARAALAAFLQQMRRRGVRCVRVVHGKGPGSPGRVPVLRDKVRRRLMQRGDVPAFVQAPPAAAARCRCCSIRSASTIAA